MIKVDKEIEIKGKLPTVAAEIAVVISEYKNMINEIEAPDQLKAALLEAFKTTVNCALNDSLEQVRERHEKIFNENPGLREKIERFKEKVTED